MAKFYDEIAYPPVGELLGDEVFIIYQAGESRTTSLDSVVNFLIAPYIDSINIGDLNNVNITIPQNYEVLVYNGGNWVNSTNALSVLSDTIISSPQENQLLQYQSGNWVNTTFSLESLSNTVITTPQDNELLIYSGGNWINGGSADSVSFIPLLVSSETGDSYPDSLSYMDLAGFGSANGYPFNDGVLMNVTQDGLLKQTLLTTNGYSNKERSYVPQPSEIFYTDPLVWDDDLWTVVEGNNDYQLQAINGSLAEHIKTDYTMSGSGDWEVVAVFDQEYDYSGYFTLKLHDVVSANYIYIKMFFSEGSNSTFYSSAGNIGDSQPVANGVDKTIEIARVGDTISFHAFHIHHDHGTVTLDVGDTYAWIDSAQFEFQFYAGHYSTRSCYHNLLDFTIDGSMVFPTNPRIWTDWELTDRNTLIDLSDTVITNPQDNEVLVYSSGEWVNTSYTLDTISDIDASTPNVDDVISWDGNNWSSSEQIGVTDLTQDFIDNEYNHVNGNSVYPLGFSVLKAGADGVTWDRNGLVTTYKLPMIISQTLDDGETCYYRKETAIINSPYDNFLTATNDGTYDRPRIEKWDLNEVSTGNRTTVDITTGLLDSRVISDTTGSYSFIRGKWKIQNFVPWQFEWRISGMFDSGSTNSPIFDVGIEDSGNLTTGTSKGLLHLQSYFQSGVRFAFTAYGFSDAGGVGDAGSFTAVDRALPYGVSWRFTGDGAGNITLSSKSDIESVWTDKSSSSNNYLSVSELSIKIAYEYNSGQGVNSYVTSDYVKFNYGNVRMESDGIVIDGASDVAWTNWTTSIDTMNDISDVTITSPSVGDILSYSSEGVWVNTNGVASFTGAVTNITIVNGIVTAIS